MFIKYLRLKSICFGLAKSIADYRSENHIQRYIYYYSLQILIGTAIELLSLFIIAFLLGIFKEVLACSIVFTTIRFFAGGFHQDTYLKCFIMTIMLMIFSAYLARIIIPIYSNTLNITIFVVSLYLVIKNAPCDTINKPITSLKIIKQLKIKSGLITLFWFIISIYILNFTNYIYLSTSIGVATIVEALSVTSWFADMSPLRKKSCAYAQDNK